MQQISASSSIAYIDTALMLQRLVFKISSHQAASRE